MVCILLPLHLAPFLFTGGTEILSFCKFKILQIQQQEIHKDENAWCILLKHHFILFIKVMSQPFHLNILAK